MDLDTVRGRHCHKMGRRLTPTSHIRGLRSSKGQPVGCGQPWHSNWVLRPIGKLCGMCWLSVSKPPGRLNANGLGSRRMPARRARSGEAVRREERMSAAAAVDVAESHAAVTASMVMMTATAVAVAVRRL